jgi:hypothetical protein
MFKNDFLFFSKMFRLIGITAGLILFHNTAIKAQDTIVKRNNEKVVAKILEVNPMDIKYKRFDYQDGPTFTIVKWELKFIMYGNGVKESFENCIAPPNEGVFKRDVSIQPSGKYYYFKNQKILEPNMLDIAWKLQDKKINLAIAKTEKVRFTKNCLIVGGIALVTGGLLTAAGVFSPPNPKTNSSTIGGGGSSRRAQRAARTQRQQIGGYMILGGISCELVSIVFNINERKYAHIVVDMYNKAVF